MTTNQNKFSAGLALGLLSIGVNELRGDKLGNEFAMAAAFRKWSAAPMMPNDVARVFDITAPSLDVILLMTELDSDKRTPAVPFHWDDHYPPCNIVIRDESQLTTLEDLKFISQGLFTGVSLEQWSELARLFISEFETPAR